MGSLAILASLSFIFLRKPIIVKLPIQLDTTQGSVAKKQSLLMENNGIHNNNNGD